MFASVPLPPATPAVNLCPRGPQEARASREGDDWLWIGQAVNPGPLQLWLPEWGTHRPSLSLEGLPCWAGCVRPGQCGQAPGSRRPALPRGRQWAALSRQEQRKPPVLQTTTFNNTLSPHLQNSSCVCALAYVCVEGGSEGTKSKVVKYLFSRQNPFAEQNLIQSMNYNNERPLGWGLELSCQELSRI